MSDIFLSYNREDQAVARKFALALKAAGHKVWWDVSLRSGEAYDEVTEGALRGAKAVVVLWSKKSVASRWVRAEATLAQRLKTILPVMIEPCDRPIMFELIQTADLTHWKGDSKDPVWQSFLNDLGQFVDGERGASLNPSSIDKASKPQLSPASRRAILIGGAAGLVVGSGLLAWKAGLFTPKGRNSIAVLPFQNLSGQKDQDYFADGLSAELRSALAQNALLQVAAPTSSNRVREQTKDSKQVAQELGVAYLLEGNVRRSGDVVRIDVTLTDGDTGISKWAKPFDRPLTDVFAVQSEISQTVVSALIAQIGNSVETVTPQGGKQGQFGSERPLGGTTNLKAFDDFLHGRELFERAEVASDIQALAYFDAAIAKDPSYAAAYSWRGRTLAVIGGQSAKAADLAKYKVESEAAVRRAVELAPTFAEAHSALGYVLFYQKLDAKAARRSYDQSQKFGSGDSDVLTSFAMFCGRTGRHQEADEHIRHAMLLDPINPSIYTSAGTLALLAGNYSRAIELFDRALGLKSTISVARALKGTALLMLGKLAESRLAFAAEPNHVFGLPGLAIVDWKLGDKAQAKATYDSFVEQNGDSIRYQQGQILSQWGDVQGALAALEQAYKIGDAGLTQLKTDPLLSGIRNEPRFLALLKAIGLD